MTSHLRDELHAMVDDAPTVDVIDRALGTARGMRRRRTGAGVAGAAGVAAAIAVPFAFAGSGHAPVSAGARPTPACGPVSPTTGSAALAPISEIVLSHLPAGYSASGAWHGVFCPSPERVPVNTYMFASSAGGQVVLALVPRADRLPGMIVGGTAPFTATNCADALATGVAPATTGPWAAPAPSSPGPLFTPSADPSGSVISPSGSFTFSPSGSPSGSPTFSPSGSPSGSPTFSPSGSPSGSPWGSPSGSPSGPPPGPPGVSATAGPGVPLRPRFCHEATPNSPLVFGFDAGSLVVVTAVGADHRAIVARSEPADGGSPVPDDQLIALVTDPELFAEIPRG